MTGRLNSVADPAPGLDAGPDFLRIAGFVGILGQDVDVGFVPALALDVLVGIPPGMLRTGHQDIGVVGVKRRRADRTLYRLPVGRQRVRGVWLAVYSGRLPGRDGGARRRRDCLRPFGDQRAILALHHHPQQRLGA